MTSALPEVIVPSGPIADLGSQGTVVIDALPDKVILDHSAAPIPGISTNDQTPVRISLREVTYEEYEQIRANDSRYPPIERPDDQEREPETQTASVEYNGFAQPGVHANTCGIIVPCTQPAPAGASSDPSITAETPEEESFDAWLSQQLEAMRDITQPYANGYLDNVSESAHGFGDQAMSVGGDIAMAGGVVAGIGAAAGATVIGAPVAAVLVPVGGFIAAVGGGVAAVGGIASGIATALDSIANAIEMGQAPEIISPAIRFGLNAIQKAVVSKVERLMGGGRGANGGYVTGRTQRGPRCHLVPYTKANQEKCKPNTLHHVVPDHVFKERGTNTRYPNTPSKAQGLTICVQGKNKNTAKDGTQISKKGFGSIREFLSNLGEHGLIHYSFDAAEAILGAAGTPTGTTSLGNMEDIGARETALVTGCSAADLKKQLRDYHGSSPFNLPEDIRVRADPTGKFFDNPPFELMGRPDKGDIGVD